MELFDTTQLALERAMAGTVLRHTALSANLANVNTPGYRRVDVDFHSALASAIDDEEGPEAARFALEVDTGAMTRADGNGVDADAEGAQLARNALEQQALATVVKARAAILRSALGVA